MRLLNSLVRTKPDRQYLLDEIIGAASNYNSVHGICLRVAARCQHRNSILVSKSLSRIRRSILGSSLYVDKRKYLYEMLKYDEFLRAMDKAAFARGVTDVWLLLKNTRIEGALFI